MFTSEKLEAFWKKGAFFPSKEVRMEGLRGRGVRLPKTQGPLGKTNRGCRDSLSRKIGNSQRLE